MGLGVRPGEATHPSRCGELGGVWWELGVHSCSGLLPVPPRQGEGNGTERHLHTAEVETHSIPYCEKIISYYSTN